MCNVSQSWTLLIPKVVAMSNNHGGSLDWARLLGTGHWTSLYLPCTVVEQAVYSVLHCQSFVMVYSVVNSIIARAPYARAPYARAPYARAPHARAGQNFYMLICVTNRFRYFPRPCWPTNFRTSFPGTMTMVSAPSSWQDAACRSSVEALLAAPQCSVAWKS